MIDDDDDDSFDLGRIDESEIKNMDSFAAMSEHRNTEYKPAEPEYQEIDFEALAKRKRKASDLSDHLSVVKSITKTNESWKEIIQ